MNKAFVVSGDASFNMRSYKIISILFFLYSMFLILPGLLYGRYETLYYIFFYGRFVLFAAIAGIFLILTKFRFADWDRVILFCWLVIGVLYVVRNLSIGSMRGILFGINILFHLTVFLSLFKTRSSIMAARTGMLWGTTVLVTLSLAITLLIPSFQIIADTGGYKIMRAGGLLNNAQQLTPYVIVSFLYLAYQLFSKKWKLYQWPLFIAVVFMAFLTGSRTAYVVLLVAFLLLLVLISRRWKRFILLVLIVFCIATFILINEIWLDLQIGEAFQAFYDKYFLRGSEEGFTSFGYRTYVWNFGLEKLQAKPLFGYGHQNIGMIVTQWGTWDEYMSHNGLLMVALEIGVIGAIPLLLLLIRSLYVAIKRMKRGDRELTLGILIMTTAILENVSESWVLSFGYVPAVILWLSIAEVALKEERIAQKQWR